MSNRVNFAKFVERKREDGSVPIDLPDGTTVTIPPSVLWPDAVSDALEASDWHAAMEAILGTEDCATYIANGGTWKLLAAIFEDAQGVDVGEAPASPAS